ncbi:MAG: hypothetical protein JXB50_06475 [Spirochaetes bacterium]|nr:hypothetical protein [Spirochaetota bacterium]
MNIKFYTNILVPIILLSFLIFNQGCNSINNPFLGTDLNDNSTHSSIFDDLNLPKDYELRIVVTWGVNPTDLDSHLTGPNSYGSRFHCFYIDKGNQLTDPFALLDIDIMNSFGPEVTTIYKINDGIYRFSVHDYTDKESISSTILSTSNANVKLYRQINGEDRLLNNFTVPNTPGTLWTVFEFDGTNIVPINTMSFQSVPNLIN